MNDVVIKMYMQEIIKIFQHIGEMKGEIKWLREEIEEERRERREVKFLAELHNFIPS